MTKNLLPAIFLTFFIFCSCKKVANDYNFSYAGSQYVGGTLSFTPVAPTNSTVLWNFGDSTTSAANVPNHSYAGPGAYTVSLMVNSDRSHIITKTVHIGADSLHQSMISGTWMWHMQSEGWYPPAMRDTIVHGPDASLAVGSITPGVVVFMKDTLTCYSLSDSTLDFYDPQAPRSTYGNTSWSGFHYNFVTNKLTYTHQYHVSAGAADWTDTYTSF